MDLDQLLSQSPKDRHRHRHPVDPAYIPAVCKDLPLNQNLAALQRNGIFPKPGVLGTF